MGIWDWFRWPWPKTREAARARLEEASPAPSGHRARLEDAEDDAPAEPVPGARPAARALSEAEAEAEFGPPTELITAPVQKEAARAAAASAASAGWPAREDIARLQDTKDEDALLRAVGRHAPGASREEVLFRYQLSRSIYFGEHKLPPLPQSAARIMELSRSPMTGVSDYARVVETDPALAKSVLSLANSSYFGASLKCTSLSQAMVRIGVREVERIALTQGFFQARVFRVYGQDDLVRDLGTHGLAAALAARAVAKRCDGPAEDAFLAGLFHDVGKLVVLGVIASVQRKLKHRAPQPLIMAAFDAFHVAIGENACRAWEIPAIIVSAVGHHHDAETASKDPLETAVYLGNAIATSLASKGHPTPVSPDDPALVAAGLSLADFSVIREQTTTDLRTYQRLDTPAPAPAGAAR